MVYAAHRQARGLWGAVIGDEVEAWVARHQDRLTPDTVS